MNQPLDPHRWDLSSLYSSPDDPRRAADQEEALARTEAFAAAHRGKIGALSGAALRDALHELGAIHRVARRVGQYAGLRASTDSLDPACRADQAAAEEFSSRLHQQLAFLGVEIAALGPAHFAALPDADALREYRVWLDTELKYAPYTLSEDAERTVARKDVTGKQAFVGLYMQTTSALQFRVVRDGQEEELTKSEVAALRTDPDRAVRRAAMDSLVDGHRPMADVLTFCVNAIFEDHRSETATRGHPDVLHDTVLSDGLTPAIVRALIDSTTANFPAVVHRWHALRKRILGLPDYGFEDTYMPAFGDEPVCTFDEAQVLVTEAFTAFDPSVGAFAARALAGGWVDVFPRKGKRSGAFCSSATLPDHAFVMLNHADRLDDTFTLAHEFGHALHFTLAQIQQPLNFHTGLPLAETASVFAELWLHEHLMATADADLRRQLLARQIDDAMGTAYRQIAYVNWELRAHARRAEGVASTDEYDAIWLEELSRLLGPDVRLDSRRDRAWWIQVPHFVFARFYCYSYAFGKLLTLSLFALWRERGAAFVADYLALLSAGGSRTPVELMAGLGLDLADPAFWQRGHDVLAGYLDELEALL